MKIFDIENYASPQERSIFSKLGIEYFCKSNAYRIADITRDNTEEIISQARAEHIPVMLRGDSPKTALELCHRYPDVIFIAGGFFSKGYTSINTAELIAKCDNVYINTSGWFTYCNYYLHELVRLAPCDRIMFGTAFPHTHPAYKKASALWELRDASQADVENIMYKNAARLFGED